MNPALSQDVETKLAPSSIEGFKMLNPRTDKELPALLGSFALRESSVDVPYTITKLDEISIYPEKNEAYSKPFGRIRRGSTLDDGYFIIENFGFDKIVEKPNGFKDFIYEKDNLNFNIEIENESEPMFTKFPDIRETPMAIQPDTAKEAQARFVEENYVLGH